MRVVIAYQDGHPVWSSNVPSDGAYYGHTLGGAAIDTSRSRAVSTADAQKKYRSAQKERAGEAQKEPQP